MMSRGILLLLVHVLVTVTAGQNWSEMHCKVPDEQLYVYRVPKHNCNCDKESEGTLRYFNKKLQICDGETFVDVTGGLAPVATTAPPAPPPTTTPKLTTPKLTTPKPTTPKLTTPKPTTPKLTTPKPTTPKLTTPKPTTPKPTTPKPTTPPPPLGDKRNPGMTCNEIASRRAGVRSGLFYLKKGGTVTKNYCYMGHICGSRGWTMIMKINGRSRTFNFDSSQWRTRSEFNPNGAGSGLGHQETKLESYWKYPFNRLCLGMQTQGIRWLTVNYRGSSLYDVIAPGHYRGFRVGRSTWKNLIPHSSLQHHCNKEGFNVMGHHSHSKARIGIISNQEGDCNSPDSRIGFGTGGGNCGENRGNSAGNEARCSPDNGNRSIFGWGFIFAQ